MDFKDTFSNSPTTLFELGEKTRQLIISLHPQIVETCHGGATVKMASYSIGRPDNVVAVISPGKDHCKLYLHHCDKIESSGIKLEGKGKHAKHVKLFSKEDFDGEIFRPILEQIVGIALGKI